MVPCESEHRKKKKKEFGGGLLLPATLGHGALDFIESAVGAGSAMFGDVASDFTSSTALASLGSSPLHCPLLGGAVDASDGGLALLRGCGICRHVGKRWRRVEKSAGRCGV